MADLVADRPTSAQLLGMPIVIWKPSASSHYRAFIDRCPHRLAPLSEGRIDSQTGHLECCYHGWQFDADGACTAIPQAENSQLLEKNKESMQETALPTCEANDLFWVWPDPNTAEVAKETPLPLSPQIDSSEGFVWSSYVRDVTVHSPLRKSQENLGRARSPCPLINCQQEMVVEKDLVEH